MTRSIALLSLALALAACGEPPPRPSLVLMVADALRADELGCGGAPYARTPHLDALARSGLQFRTCVSQSPERLPALATILTGRFPSGHGAILEEHEVAPGVPMLAEGIRSRSYRTAAFLETDRPAEGYGLERGFDVFDARSARTAPQGGPAPVDTALSWVRTDWRPHFLVVSPGGGAGTVDGTARRLLLGLEERGTRSHTFVMFTAARGDIRNPAAGDGAAPLHGRLLDVPMIVAAPQWIAPALRDDPAMLIDVFPTALQCLGFAPTRVPGRGLVRIERDGGEGAPERPLYAEVADGLSFAKSVRLRDWRAVHDEVAGTWRLHDLAADPGETRDVAADHPEKLAELQAAMPEPGAFDVPAPRSD